MRRFTDVVVVVVVVVVVAVKSSTYRGLQNLARQRPCWRKVKRTKKAALVSTDTGAAS